MPNPAAEWYQQSLTPPEVIEVRARLGIVAETDHLQAIVEVFDPMTGVLIGQTSCPHAPIRQMGTVIEWMSSAIRRMAEDNTEPF